jgi:pentatricopeptide repeat protein
MSDLQSAPSLTPDILSFSALVEAYARAGRPSEAASWLEAARQAGVEPNVVTFGTVAKGYAVAGDFAAAHRVLDGMEEAGVRPNTGTYQVRVCVRG